MLSRRNAWVLVHRASAVMLAAVMMVGPALAASTDAAETAEIRGMVLSGDGLTAVMGVVVKVAHMSSRQVYSSAATAADGSYVLSGLPTGWYDLAVETADATFVSDSLVRTTAGKQTKVSVALKAAEGDEGEEGQGQDEGEESDPAEGDEGQGADDTESEEPPQKQKKPKGKGFFKSPGGAAVLIVGGSAALAAAAKNATNDESSITVPPPMTGGSGGS